MHVRGGEGLGRKVGDPITELVVKRHDEVTLIVVQGVADFEGHLTSITMGQQVGWLDTISQ